MEELCKVFTSIRNSLTMNMLKKVGGKSDLEFLSAEKPAGTTDCWGDLQGRHSSSSPESHQTCCTKRHVGTAGCAKGPHGFLQVHLVEVTLSEVLTDNKENQNYSAC